VAVILDPKDENKIAVLDKGFVRLVDRMGDDRSIVQAARVSYGPGTKTLREDKGLIHYLMRHQHTSPFEMCEYKFHLKLPIFVMRQLVRHRTACLSGDSLLYFDLPGAEKRGGRQRHTMEVGKFHDLWHGIAVQKCGTKRKPSFEEKVDKTRWYSIPELSRLVERREEHLRAVIRSGKLAAETRQGGPTDPKLFVLGAEWHRYANASYERTIPLQRERLQAMQLRMCDELTGEIKHTSITNIWETGTRPVFRVTLANGYSLKMTKDHLCLTEKGWKRLEDAVSLRVNERGGVSWSNASPRFATNGIDFWQTNQIKLERPKQKTLPRIRRLIRTFSAVEKIEYIGEEKTYDLSVSGPFHNFVANGFIVHNSLNEISGRYSELPGDFFLPDPNNLRMQSKRNKQATEDDICLSRADAARTVEDMSHGQRDAYFDYNAFLARGLARELARIHLPVSIYTECYWKMDLRNLLHFIKLRLEAHAQKEMREYAKAIAFFVKRHNPIAYEAFEEYVLNAKTLSVTELRVVRKLLLTALDLAVDTGSLEFEKSVRAIAASEGVKLDDKAIQELMAKMGFPENQE
jgi:flavin-dependent thymidylate synthase